MNNVKFEQMKTGESVHFYGYFYHDKHNKQPDRLNKYGIINYVCDDKITWQPPKLLKQSYLYQVEVKLQNPLVLLEQFQDPCDFICAFQDVFEELNYDAIVMTPHPSILKKSANDEACNDGSSFSRYRWRRDCLLLKPEQSIINVIKLDLI